MAPRLAQKAQSWGVRGRICIDAWLCEISRGGLLKWGVGLTYPLHNRLVGMSGLALAVGCDCPLVERMLHGSRVPQALKISPKG